MAAAKRRRKPAKKYSGIGAGWWLAGLLGVGWIVHGANPSLLTGLYDKAASIAGTAEPKGQPTRVASRPPATARQAATAPLPSAQRPDRLSDVAAVAKPAMRPAVATATRPVLKRGQLRLLSEPKDGSTIRATVEPGKTLRIVESKGEWRRVEAGIFTGWVRAASLGNPPAMLPTAMRAPAIQRERAERRLVPPATVDGRN